MEAPIEQQSLAREIKSCHSYTCSKWNISRTASATSVQDVTPIVEIVPTNSMDGSVNDYGAVELRDTVVDALVS